MLYKLGQLRVSHDARHCFIAPNAAVIGRVSLGMDVSIWFNATVRGDVAAIDISDETNIQDNAVVHVDDDAPARIDRRVTVGHGATVHGCHIGEGSLIGIGATILSHAVIGRHCIVGAHALITERKQFPDRSLIVGVPAKRVREVTEEEILALERSADHYAELGRRYAAELAPDHD